MTKWQSWVIEPRDPLIVRDGRPFNATPGARAKSLPFPYPSTVAGAVRSLAGRDNNSFFDRSLIAQVKQVHVRGPLLAELDGDKVQQLMVSAPADAVLFTREDDKAQLDRHQLLPKKLGDGSFVDKELDGLFPVFLVKPNPSKPAKNAPVYWYWSQFKQWLLNPQVEETIQITELGHGGPTADRRTHVAIDPQTFSGIEGYLFMTSGQTFWHNGDEHNAFSCNQRLGLVVEVSELDAPLTLTSGYNPMGGEQRMMHWRESNEPFPKCPPDLIESIAKGKRCRLILLTPAHFQEGWKPTYLLEKRHNVTVTLQAAVVGSPHTVSGWDFEKKQPKPTRRLAPAGSVYFLELSGKDADICQWVEETWMACLSDEVEDREAGFGLTAVGCYKPVKEEADAT